MSHKPVSWPASGKLDKQLARLDSSHQARQSAKSVPAKLSNKPIKPPR
jgi:hypothetical protein